MSAGFHEIRFPTDISYDSAGGPEFSTDVVKVGSGFESRNQNWTYPLERWNVAYGVTTLERMQVLYEFFMARRGRAFGFRFKNHDDYLLVAQLIAIGDGVDDEFQIVKTYEDAGPAPLTRKISKPVDGTIVVSVGGVVQVEDVNYTIDYATGLITFASGSTPGSGEDVEVAGQFDVPMRFDVDFLPSRLSTYLHRAADVPLVEVRIR